MKKVFTVLLVLFLCALFFFAGRGCTSGTAIPSSNEVVVDSTTTEVSVPDTAPVPRDSVVIRYQYVDVPLTPPPITGDTLSEEQRTDNLSVTINGDTAEVAIPITQTLYETDNYRAYVSGYRARLDSCYVKSTTTTIRIREPTEKKRFSIGLQAGYGMTPKGFQPYIGIGVSVNLWSF